MRNALVAIAIVAGCAETPPAFRPTSPTAETPGGVPAVAVEIRGDARPVAHVLLWSASTSVATAGARDGGVQLVVEVLNVGTGTLVFDATAVALDAFDRRGAALPAARLVSVSPAQAGSIAIAPATAATVELFFVLPSPPVAVHDVRLRWALVAPDGERHVQDTRFTRVVERRRKHYAYEPSFMLN